MKRIFITILLCFPILCTANNALEFELVRTPETPGFFAVTLFPAKDAQPLGERIIFVKNFTPEETQKYAPVVNFLTELGVKVTDTLPINTTTMRVVSIGNTLPGSENFQTQNETSALEQFELFALQNLKPVFFKNLRAEFGGNISAVAQSQENLTGDDGVTFIGKFEKDMRTRMAIVADDDKSSLQFDTPLNLADNTNTQHPLSEKLPEIWEQLHIQKDTNNAFSFSLVPWILGVLILLILCVIFMHRTRRKYRKFLKQEDSQQQTIPWEQVSKEENTPENPFELG